MTDRELMQQALDALSMAVEPKKGKVYAFEFQPIDCAAMYLKAIEALRARLAQPEREWQGLTPEEAREISLANRPYVVDMVAALEAKLKEKNT